MHTYIPIYLLSIYLVFIYLSIYLSVPISYIKSYFVISISCKKSLLNYCWKCFMDHASWIYFQTATYTVLKSLTHITYSITWEIPLWTNCQLVFRLGLVWEISTYCIQLVFQHVDLLGLVWEISWIIFQTATVLKSLKRITYSITWEISLWTNCQLVFRLGLVWEISLVFQNRLSHRMSLV